MASCVEMFDYPEGTVFPLVDLPASQYRRHVDPFGGVSICTKVSVHPDGKRFLHWVPEGVQGD